MKKVTIWFIVFLIPFLLIKHGVHDWKLFRAGDALAAQLPLCDLEVNGSKSNSHVYITDFELGEEHIPEYDGETWIQTWIPMYPANSTSETIRVLMFSKGITSEESVEALYERDYLEGLMRRDKDSLNSDTINKLKMAYPKLNLQRVFIFEEGATLPERKTIAYQLIGGLLIFIIAIFILLKPS